MVGGGKRFLFLFSILSFLSMVAPQSRIDLQGSMLWDRCPDSQGPRYSGFKGPWPRQNFSVLAAGNIYSSFSYFKISVTFH